jgi:plasmid stabilization system protein ParE
MAKYKIEWSIEARLDLIDILEYYIERNKSATYSKKLIPGSTIALTSFPGIP